MLRSLALLLAFTALLTPSAALGQSQNREPDLSDLWGEYPLDQSQDGLQRLQSRERDGSTAGPPPRAPQPGGPIALALLYVMLALGAISILVAFRGLAHATLARVRLVPRVGGWLGRERKRAP